MTTCGYVLVDLKNKIIIIIIIITVRKFTTANSWLVVWRQSRTKKDDHSGNDIQKC